MRFVDHFSNAVIPAGSTGIAEQTAADMIGHPARPLVKVKQELGEFGTGCGVPLSKALAAAP